MGVGWGRKIEPFDKTCFTVCLSVVHVESWRLSMEAKMDVKVGVVLSDIQREADSVYERVRASQECVFRFYHVPPLRTHGTFIFHEHWPQTHSFPGTGRPLGSRHRISRAPCPLSVRIPTHRKGAFCTRMGTRRSAPDPGPRELPLLGPGDWGSRWWAEERGR